MFTFIHYSLPFINSVIFFHFTTECLIGITQNSSCIFTINNLQFLLVFFSHFFVGVCMKRFLLLSSVVSVLAQEPAKTTDTLTKIVPATTTASIDSTQTSTPSTKSQVPEPSAAITPPPSQEAVPVTPSAAQPIVTEESADDKILAPTQAQAVVKKEESKKINENTPKSENPLQSETVQAGSTGSLSLNDLFSLGNIYCIGYGVQKEKDITGSIGNLDVEAIQKSFGTTITDFMKGRLAGVQTISRNGLPIEQNYVNRLYGQNGNALVLIRGIGTISLSSEPIFVVDGVVLDIGEVSALNPKDFAGVQVLKDASSAAIYGVKSANGVVVITTKRGRPGQVKISGSASFGYQQVPYKQKIMDKDQYLEYLQKYYYVDSLKTFDTTQVKWAYDSLPDANTDWQAELYRLAPVQMYSMSIDGGSENAKMYLSASYLNQEGIVINTGKQRTTLRLNMDYKGGNLIRAGESVNLFHVKDNLNDGKVKSTVAMLAAPQMPVKDTANYNGYGAPSIGQTGANIIPNIVALANLSEEIVNNTGATGNVYGELRILPSLWLRSDFNFNANYLNYYKVLDSLAQGTSAATSEGMINEYLLLTKKIASENYFKFEKEISAHSINSTAGISISNDEVKYYGILGGAHEYGTKAINAAKINVTEGTIERSKNISYFGRLQYNYDGKYYLSTSIREDGSSVFSPDNRWGTFPAVSAGWKFSEETFAEALKDYIADAKIRVSWGRAGRSGGTYWSLLNDAIKYSFNNTAQRGQAPSQRPNSDLTWEQSEQTDFGLDIYSVRDLFTLNMDYFRLNASNVLVQSQEALYTGRSQPAWENKASCLNEGLEFTIKHANVFGPVTYNSNANVSFLRNKVTDLGISEDIFGVPPNQELFQTLTITQKNKPMQSFYGYVAEGIFKDSADLSAHATQPGARIGDRKFKDIDGNKVIDDKDRTIIGNPLPDITYGINLSATYNRFDFNFLFQGVYGNEVFNFTKYMIENTNTWNNGSVNKLDAWSKDNPSSEIPAISSSNPNNNSRVSTYFIEDGSYFRLRDMQIGYTLDSSWVRPIHAKSARFYVGISNLFTITATKLFDPDVASIQSSNYERKTYIGYEDPFFIPNPRIYNAGLQVDF